MDVERTILHADLDAFFASVEQLDDPALRGRPVLVGGRGRRGVVSAASYEARAFGCRSAMPVRAALALCPHALVVPTRFDRYRELSQRFMKILERMSPLVETLGLDEAFVDATGCEKLLGDGRNIGQRIRDAVRDELSITCSVGVAPCKFVAKLASDLQKPDGLTVIAAAELPGAIAHLSIGRMWGVGPATLPFFERQGLRTFGDLQRLTEDEAKRLLGDHGAHYRRLALAEDDRVVDTEHDARSVGHEQTFGEDLDDPEEVLDVIQGQCERVGLRLRHSQGVARSVTVKIRFGDFRTITRSATFDQPSDHTSAIWIEAEALFRAWAGTGFRPVRLVGVSVSRESRSGSQLALFEDSGAERSGLDAVTDRIVDRFGRDAISRGRRLRRDRRDE